MYYIENKIFSEINVGDSASLEHTLTIKDIELFAIMSGDVNPAHVDIEFAKDDMFHGVIAHGMWAASLISTLLGTTLPGAGTIYLGQTLKFSNPIRLGDVVDVSVTVINKREDKKIIEFDCKCVTQDNKIAISGVANVIAPSVKIKRERIVMPDITIGDYKNNLLLKKLYLLKKGMEPLITAVVHPVDELSIAGAFESAKDGIITPILVGPEQKIIDAAKSANVDISGYKIINTMHSHESVDVAVALAKKGKVEALMKGKLHTNELMAAVVNKQTGLRTNRRMSHILAIELDSYSKPLFLSDAVLNLFPTLDEKIDIVQNAIDLFNTLDMGNPKVAIVSAVETINEKIPSTLDAAVLCKMADRGQITGGILDGPLGFDNAISPEAVKVKGITSNVAGNADIIIVPDIESGNLLYKQMTYMSKMEAAGVVIGAKVPIILTSRGSDVESRKYSSLLALVYSRRNHLK